ANLHPIDMVLLRQWMVPAEVERVIMEAVQLRERRGRRPIPDEVRDLIADATARQQRTFALACAMHAIAAVEGEDSSLYFFFVLLRRDAISGCWDSTGQQVGTEILDTFELLTTGAQVAAKRSVVPRARRAAIERLYRCCGTALLADPTRAAEE